MAMMCFFDEPPSRVRHVRERVGRKLRRLNGYVADTRVLFFD